MTLAARLAELGLSEEIVAQAHALEEIAETHRHLTHARGAVNLTDAAKVLELAPKRLIAWLLGHDWIFREGERLCAYQGKLEAGLLKQKIIRLYRVDGSESMGIQVFITAKGLARLTRELPDLPTSKGANDDG